MQEQWKGKSVDLKLLVYYIEGFFKNKGFGTFRKESNQAYKISVTSTEGRDSSAVVVRVSGNPNDFVLELDPIQEARFSKVLGSLGVLFGGGSLFLRGLKSEELLRKIEGEFWSFAEDAVERLSGSAKE